MSGFWIVIGNNIAELAGMIFIGWSTFRFGRWKERKWWENKTGKTRAEMNE